MIKVQQIALLCHKETGTICNNRADFAPTQDNKNDTNPAVFADRYHTYAEG